MTAFKYEGQSYPSSAKLKTAENEPCFEYLSPTLMFITIMIYILNNCHRKVLTEIWEIFSGFITICNLLGLYASKIIAKYIKRGKYVAVKTSSLNVC